MRADLLRSCGGQSWKRTRSPEKKRELHTGRKTLGDSRQIQTTIILADGAEPGIPHIEDLRWTGSAKPVYLFASQKIGFASNFKRKGYELSCIITLSCPVEEVARLVPAIIGYQRDDKKDDNYHELHVTGVTLAHKNVDPRVGSLAEQCHLL